MPPCIWMLSSATSAPMRPMLALAADSARSRVARSAPSTAAAALMTAERACSISSSRSAMRCCSAWKLPISMPNCLRVRRYSSVAVFRGFHRAQAFGAQREHAAADGALQHRVALAFGAEQRVGAERHARQHDFGRAAAVDRRCSRARRRLSSSRGTRNSEMPASSSTPPAVRAETRNRSACSPCSTTALAPSSNQPSPWRSARVCTRDSS